MGTTKYYGVTAKALAVAAIAITMTASAWAAGKEKVLLSFQGPNGGNPTAGVIADAEGNLYGAAADGGEFGFGNVFKLTQNKNGTWTQTVLYSFKGDDASDGQVPLASLILDGEGNLYGTTGGGGTHPPIRTVPFSSSRPLRAVHGRKRSCIRSTAPKARMITTAALPIRTWSSIKPAIFMARPTKAVEVTSRPFARTDAEPYSSWRRTRMAPGRRA